MIVLKMEIEGVAMDKTPLEVFEDMVLSPNFKRTSLTSEEGGASATYEHRERVGEPKVGVPMVPVLTVKIEGFHQE